MRAGNRPTESPANGRCAPGPARRPGFTVLEVIVALTVGAMVLVGARVMLGAIADGGEAIRGQATANDRDANTERLLRTLLRQVETSAAGADFGGDRGTLAFSSWCAVPGGWQERCRVSVSVVETIGQSRLVATLSTGESFELLYGFSAAEWRYVGDAARGGTWFEVWGEGIALPVALGLLVRRDSVADTLLFRVGAR